MTKKLIKYIPRNCRCKFHSRCNWSQKWNNDKCNCECGKSMKHCVCKDYIWNPSACTCDIDEYWKNYAYTKSLINDSVITGDEIIDMWDTVSTHSISKEIKYKMDYYVFHTTLLVTICLLLLIFIANNCYYIKHQSKQKNILPYYLYYLSLTIFFLIKQMPVLENMIYLNI